MHGLGARPHGRHRGSAQGGRPSTSSLVRLLFCTRMWRCMNFARTLRYTNGRPILVQFQHAGAVRWFAVEHDRRTIAWSSASPCQIHVRVVCGAKTHHTKSNHNPLPPAAHTLVNSSAKPQSCCVFFARALETKAAVDPLDHPAHHPPKPHTKASSSTERNLPCSASKLWRIGSTKFQPQKAIKQLTRQLCVLSFRTPFLVLCNVHLSFTVKPLAQGQGPSIA